MYVTAGSQSAGIALSIYYISGVQITQICSFSHSLHVLELFITDGEAYNSRFHGVIQIQRCGYQLSSNLFSPHRGNYIIITEKKVNCYWGRNLFLSVFHKESHPNLKFQPPPFPQALPDCCILCVHVTLGHLAGY